MAWQSNYRKLPGGILGALAILLVSSVAALAQNPQDSRQDQDYDQNRRTDARDQQYRTERQRTQRTDQYDRDRDQRDSRDTRWDDNQSDRRTRDDAFRSDQRTTRDDRDGQDAGLGVSIIEASGQGVTVTRIHPDSPAEEMGLREGDRITHFNGQPVRSVQSFISSVRNMDPGARVELDVQRRSGQRRFAGELETREEALVFRGQPRDGSSNFDQRRVTQYDDQFGRTPNVSARLNSLERQIDRLSRELEQLRFAVQDRDRSRFARQPQGGRDWDGETQTNFQEYNRAPERPRSTNQWNEFENRGTRSFDRDESPGGETGSDRLRPGSSDREQ